MYYRRLLDEYIRDSGTLIEKGVLNKRRMIMMFGVIYSLIERKVSRGVLKKILDDVELDYGFKRNIGVV